MYLSEITKSFVNIETWYLETDKAIQQIFLRQNNRTNASKITICESE